MRYAIIENNQVFNVIEAATQDDANAVLTQGQVAIAGADANIGDSIENNVIIPKPTPLNDLKSAKLGVLNTAMSTDMAAGFTSDALGATHSYDGEEHNQINLLGIKMRGQGGLFTCDDMLDNPDSKQRRQHTAQQIDQVFADGYAYKEALIDKLRNKRAAVLTAETPEAVEAITWESVE